MCGRTACTLAPDELKRACSYRNRRGQRRQPRWRDGDADNYRPSYNKNPQSTSPVLLSQRHFDKVIITYTEANMSTVCYSLTYIGEAPEEGGRCDVFK